MAPPVVGTVELEGSSSTVGGSIPPAAMTNLDGTTEAGG